MARLVSTLTVQMRGVVECKRSMESIGEAAQNAYLDIEDIDIIDGSMAFKGMLITSMETIWEEGSCVFVVKPTGGMIIFIGWLMANLPSSAFVNWIDGWPMVRCPPNDDCDYEDDPTPPAPDELELA